MFAGSQARQRMCSGSNSRVSSGREKNWKHRSLPAVDARHPKHARRHSIGSTPADNGMERRPSIESSPIHTGGKARRRTSLDCALIGNVRSIESFYEEAAPETAERRLSTGSTSKETEPCPSFESVSKGRTRRRHSVNSATSPAETDENRMSEGGMISLPRFSRKDFWQNRYSKGSLYI